MRSSCTFVVSLLYYCWGLIMGSMTGDLLLKSQYSGHPGLPCAPGANIGMACICCT